MNADMCITSHLICSSGVGSSCQAAGLVSASPQMRD
jgi:hypothetical protein